MNEGRTQTSDTTAAVSKAAGGKSGWQWKNYLGGLLVFFLGALCGATLIVLPWSTGWDQNFFSGLHPRWYSVWTNYYFRGAVSGIGVLNLYLAIEDLVQTARGRRP